MNISIVRKGICLSFLLCFCHVVIQAQNILFRTNPQTGAIQSIRIEGDETDMDWLTATDGSQYRWIKQNYGWGLGYMTLDGQQHTWNTPEQISTDSTVVHYRIGDITLQVKRTLTGNDLLESYTFTNTGTLKHSLTDVGIYTPLCDNYPNSKTCIPHRANVHIWEGENAAYLNTVRMGGFPPHLGMAVTEGAIKAYELWERGNGKGGSHTRGIISLDLADTVLLSKQSVTLTWKIFSYTNEQDFVQKLVDNGSVAASCNKYLLAKGEKVEITLLTAPSVKKCVAKYGMKHYSMKKKKGHWTVQIPMNQLGTHRIELCFDRKTTHVDVQVISGEEELLDKRVKFIMEHQQMNQPHVAQGAYMVYDNENNSIYLNNTRNSSPADRDAGGERLGMGVLLAKYYQLHPSDELKQSLLSYARFVRRIQDKNYRTFQDTGHSTRNRPYSYPWVAQFYFEMYKITDEKQYAIDGYRTMKAFYRQFGYNFYAIGTPIYLGCETLKAAGLTAEYDDLLTEYKKMGEQYIKTGTNYPSSEVQYEQAIVVPGVIALLELYKETHEQKYLNEARRQFPVVESFCGNQPSFHLNGIANRHWDGYWFGKREQYGDTFPHYWSVLNASACQLLGESTEDTAYIEKARNIVRNNLCLFFEDGKASCAYLYPYKVDGKPTQYYDAYANDQDWALVYYLQVNHNIY